MDAAVVGVATPIKREVSIEEYYDTIEEGADPTLALQTVQEVEEPCNHDKAGGDRPAGQRPHELEQDRGKPDGHLQCLPESLSTPQRGLGSGSPATCTSPSSGQSGSTRANLRDAWLKQMQEEEENIRASPKTGWGAVWGRIDGKKDVKQEEESPRSETVQDSVEINANYANLSDASVLEAVNKTENGTEAASKGAQDNGTVQENENSDDDEYETGSEDEDTEKETEKDARKPGDGAETLESQPTSATQSKKKKVPTATLR